MAYPPIDMSKMVEMATLVQVGKSMLESLESGSLSSQKALKLGDPVSIICRLLLLAIKKDVDLEGLRSWVAGVSEALYEASELVDQAVADGAASSLVSKVRCRSLFGVSSLFGVRMGLVINRLCQKLHLLKQQATGDTSLLGLSLEDEHETLMAEPLPVVTPAHYDMDTMVGREEDRECIIDKLLDTSDLNRHISVVSIVGIGGLGKTTLARSIYNDDRITDHFDLKSWVCVSDEFDLKSIVKSMILSCSPASSRIGDLGLEQGIDLLKVKITGKLFLLVLDDVWNEGANKWFPLLTLLQVGARGSRILVTTRSFRVANICGAGLIHELEGLSDERAWILFKSIAFGALEPTEDLTAIAKSIVRRCLNVPLAIVVVAICLQGLSVEEWLDASLSFLLPKSCEDGVVSIVPILQCSYSNLPLPLKVCFAYCSLFPCDHEISVSDLVSLWMAQGYIGPENSEDDLEDIAMQYFLTLSKRYIFINEKLDAFGNIATCQMHGLINDVALSVAAHWRTMKHLSLYQRDGETSLQGNWMNNECKIQTLLHCFAVVDEYSTGRITVNDIVKMSKFKSLRVLDLHAFGLMVIPDSIGNLIHLRYLDFSHNEALLKLPNSISNLYHLQTLKLNFCYELEELPASIGKLVRLRRLEIDGCEKLTFMPPSFKNLSSLRTLSRFVVGRPRSQISCGFEALGNLNHLQGRLMIDLSENWATTVNEAEKSYLSNRLIDLEIKWGPTRSATETDTVQYRKLLDGLQPPSGLKYLQIEGYRGQDFPTWASGNALLTAMPYLITVSIDGCGRCTTLPPFSKLPCLRRLSLRFMDNVQYFESSDDNLPSTSASLFFPHLEELTLNSFYSLEGWWKKETRVLSASFSCLRKLKIWRCPKLTSMPLFPNVEVLDMQNINEKLLEIHSAWVTRSEIKTPTDPSSSHSEISNFGPSEHLQNLQDLTTVQIKSCPRVKTLALLTSSGKLKKLVLERLDMLSSLTEVLKQLASLEELEVASCKDLDLSGRCHDSCNGCEECEVPWKFLSKLHRLILRELPKLVTLPVGLKCVTSLQHLRLEGCPELKMLPEGLKDIKSLVKVDIIECPQLMERCRIGGEDWHKIKHARVLHHKSWRYALMSETELSQKPKEKGKKCCSPFRRSDHSCRCYCQTPQH